MKLIIIDRQLRLHLMAIKYFLVPLHVKVSYQPVSGGRQLKYSHHRDGLSGT
ncbi:MAG TPA: hypothetical protein VGK38_06775 [Prolixibacteraceae bacterium]